MNAFKYFVSNDFESQKNLEVDLILIVRRFKLMGMGKRDTIAGQLLGGAMVQIPVKRLARALKVDRNKFRFKRGFEPKKITF